ncbi:hypothetical protein GDO78_022318 [Eleutherodactylus coqui]|uniref:Uncharacterized protein n=1 Tax=Eleutherodactylus coqui TaxID=57060 RepID=A0A8J6BMP5_ELECQ|nr:hypothetical protein GDO78_022318 [Eleutherodactylus coqui]
MQQAAILSGSRPDCHSPFTVILGGHILFPSMTWIAEIILWLFVIIQSSQNNICDQCLLRGQMEAPSWLPSAARSTISLYSVNLMVR